jgi:hypothetical protein
LLAWVKNVDNFVSVVFSACCEDNDFEFFTQGLEEFLSIWSNEDANFLKKLELE